MARVSASSRNGSRTSSALDFPAPFFPQKHPPAGERQFGPVVLPDVDDAGTVQHPATDPSAGRRGATVAPGGRRGRGADPSCFLQGKLWGDLLTTWPEPCRDKRATAVHRARLAQPHVDQQVLHIRHEPFRVIDVLLRPRPRLLGQEAGHD